MTHTIASTIETNSRGVFAWFHRLLRQRVIKQLASIKGYHLIIQDPCGHIAIGKSGQQTLQLRINDLACYRLCAFQGHLGFAEAYGRGMVTCDSLTELLLLFAQNLTITDAAETGWARIANLGQYLYYRYVEANTVA